MILILTSVAPDNDGNTTIAVNFDRVTTFTPAGRATVIQSADPNAAQIVVSESFDKIITALGAKTP